METIAINVNSEVAIAYRGAEVNKQQELIAVCKKVRTRSKIEKELKVKKWEQLTQKI